jgi:hypothetical protein
VRSAKKLDSWLAGLANYQKKVLSEKQRIKRFNAKWQRSKEEKKEQDYGKLSEKQIHNR